MIIHIRNAEFLLGLAVEESKLLCLCSENLRNLFWDIQNSEY
jgi:hypothetical protein